MTIGVGRPYQRQGIAAALLETLIVSARRQGRKRMLWKSESTTYRHWRVRKVRLHADGIAQTLLPARGIDARTAGLDLEPRVVGFNATADTKHAK